MLGIRQYVPTKFGKFKGTIGRKKIGKLSFTFGKLGFGKLSLTLCFRPSYEKTFRRHISNHPVETFRRHFVAETSAAILSSKRLVPVVIDLLNSFRDRNRQIIKNRQSIKPGHSIISAFSLSSSIIAYLNHLYSAQVSQSHLNAGEALGERIINTRWLHINNSAYESIITTRTRNELLSAD